MEELGALNHGLCDKYLHALEMKRMGPLEYEQHVADIVREMQSFRGAKISTNRQFKGVRQPGSYEIDIAVEWDLDDLLKFILIIECKNWGRPVDRPVIQKLIQTRDAIAAQKAAVVSPVGFSKEAVDVASSNGVALWVVAQESSYAVSVMGFIGPRPWAFEYDRLRIELAEIAELRDVQNARRVIRYWWIGDMHAVPPYEYCEVSGSATTGYQDVCGVDSKRASTEVMNALLQHIESVGPLETPTTKKLRSWKLEKVEGLVRKGIALEEAEEAIAKIIKNEECWLDGYSNSWLW